MFDKLQKQKGENVFTKKDHMTVQSFKQSFFFLSKIYHVIGTGDDVKTNRTTSSWNGLKRSWRRKEKRKQGRNIEEKKRKGKKMKKKKKRKREKIKERGGEG